MATSPLIYLEHRATYDSYITLPRTPEQAAWIAPTIIAGAVLALAIIATWITLRSLQKGTRLRSIAGRAGAALILVSIATGGFSLYQSAPDSRVVESKQPILPLLQSEWEQVSDDDLLEQIHDRYGVDVPERYVDRIQELRFDDAKPVWVVALDGTAVRECDVWSAGGERAAVLLHCD